MCAENGRASAPFKCTSALRVCQRAASVYPHAECVGVEVGWGRGCWLITRCSFENRGAFILSGERHRAKCQTLEINSFVMTTLDGGNNTGEEVGGVAGVTWWKWREVNKRGKGEVEHFLYFPLTQLPEKPPYVWLWLFNSPHIVSVGFLHGASFDLPGW